MNDPKPGSEEALSAGCKCPVRGNNWGKGRHVDADHYWVVSNACPLHRVPALAALLEAVDGGK